MTSRLLKYLTVFILSVAFIFSPFSLKIPTVAAATEGISCDLTDESTGVKVDGECQVDCSQLPSDMTCPRNFSCVEAGGFGWRCFKSSSSPSIDTQACIAKGSVPIVVGGTDQCVPCNASVIKNQPNNAIIPNRANSGCATGLICQTTNGTGRCVNPPSAPGGAGKGITQSQAEKGAIEAKADISAQETAFGNIGECKFNNKPIYAFLGYNLAALLTLIAAGTSAGALTSIPIAGGAARTTANAIDHIISNYIDALIIGTVASLGLMLGAMLIQAGLQMSDGIAKNNPIVTEAFKITLGLANIAFVIILIVLGIATILRRKEYDTTKILINLVIAILLINFSIFIVQFLTDITNVLMKAFIGTSCPSLTLINNLNVASVQSDILGDASWWIKLISSPVVIYAAVVITVIGFLITSFLAVYLILRYIILSLLIIGMPIAWVGFVFPQWKLSGGIGNPWTYWWDKFTAWLIAGPIIAFFLYLMPLFLSTTIISGKGVTLAVFNTLIKVIITLTVGILGVIVTNNMSGAASKLISAGVGKTFGAGMKAISNFRQRAGLTQMSKTEKEIEDELAKGPQADQKKIAALRAKSERWKGIGGIGAGATFTTGLLRRAGINEQFMPSEATKIRLDIKKAEGELSDELAKGALADPKKVAKLREKITKLEAKAAAAEAPIIKPQTVAEFRKSFGDPSKITLGEKTYDQLTKDEALTEFNRLGKEPINTSKLQEQKLALMRKLAKQGNLGKVDPSSIYGKNLDKEIEKFGIDFDKEFAPHLGMNRASYDAKKKSDAAGGEVNDKQNKFDELNKQATEQSRILSEAQTTHSAATSIITQAQGELTIAEQKLTDARVNNPRLIGTYKDQVLKINNRISKAQTEQSDAQSTIDRIASSTITQEAQAANIALQSAIASSQAASNNFTAELSNLYKGFDAGSMKSLPINDLLKNFDPNSPTLGVKSQPELEELRSYIESALIQNPSKISAVAAKVEGKNYDQFALETVNSALTSVGAGTFTDPNTMRDQLGRSSIIKSIKSKNQPLGEEIEKILNNLP